MEVHTKQGCGTEVLHREKILPIDIHQHLLNVYGDQTVDVSTVRQWVVCCSSGNSRSPLLYILKYHLRDNALNTMLYFFVNSEVVRQLDLMISVGPSN